MIEILMILTIIILTVFLIIYFTRQGRCESCYEWYPIRKLNILEASEESSFLDKYICDRCGLFTCYSCEEKYEWKNVDVCPHCKEVFCNTCFAEHDCPEWEPDWDLMNEDK